MIMENRRKRIVELVNENDVVTVEEFSKRFNVSAATIRNDLNFLAENRLLTRVHGGAIPLVKHQVNKNLEAESRHGFSFRKKIYVKEKIAIAKKALDYIEDGDCIILDGSSTCYELARLLKNTDKHLTVITNGIRTANLLKLNINVTVLLIGGILQGDSNTTKSLIGADLLNQVNTDKIFFSADGLSLPGGFSGSDFFEVELKKQMLTMTSQQYALIDSSKFDAISLSYFLEPSPNITVITNSKIKTSSYKLYSKHFNLVLSEYI